MARTSKGDRVALNVKVPREWMEAVKAHAAEVECSVTEFLVDLVSAHMKVGTACVPTKSERAPSAKPSLSPTAIVIEPDAEFFEEIKREAIASGYELAEFALQIMEGRKRPWLTAEEGDDAERQAKPSTESRALVPVQPSKVMTAKQALQVAEEHAAHLAKPRLRDVHGPGRAESAPTWLDEVMDNVPIGPQPFVSRLKGQPTAPGRRR